MGDPVTQDNHTRFLRQLKIDFDVAMAIDEIVDIGVILDVLLGEAHEIFAVLTHIRQFLTIRTLQATVLGPVEAEPHAPARMEG